MSTYHQIRFAVTDGSIPNFVQAATASEALSKVQNTEGLHRCGKEEVDGLTPTWYVFPVLPDQEDLIKSLEYPELMELIGRRDDVICYG